MLSAAIFASAQTANDYWLAADKALAAGDTDSTFYYLNLFREKFGRQYAFAYTTFLTEEDYRTLHNDARWTAFMDSMRTYKHETEDKREITYPRKAVVEDTNAPTVKRYDIQLNIDVEKKTLAVTATAQIDFKGGESINFTLWKNSTINLVRYKKKELTYSFKTKAKSTNTYSQHHVANETTLTANLVQPLSHIMVIAEEEHTNACVKQVFFHSSISLLFVVLLSQISLIISSAERLSFQAPANRFAHSASAFVFFAGTNDFTKANILVIADSLSRSGLISRNNSARNSIAVIIVWYLFACKDTKKN